MNGVLIVDKPQGLTSHDVVARIRRLLKTKKTGHLGTLDPMATGVLPLVIGKATKLASLLSVGKKSYEAVIHLGKVTDTYDVTGSPSDDFIETKHLAETLTLETIKVAAKTFTGNFLQQPPPYSAKKVNGTRAYRLARKNVKMQLSPTEVCVHALEISAFRNNRLFCKITCSRGFYVRSLAHDLGQHLGCGGCLEQLRRTQSGVFTLQQSVHLDEFVCEINFPVKKIIPMNDLLPELPVIVVTDSGSRNITHGNTVTKTEISSVIPKRKESTGLGDINSQIKVLSQTGNLLAIAELGPGDALHPRIVLV